MAGPGDVVAARGRRSGGAATAWAFSMAAMATRSAATASGRRDFRAAVRSRRSAADNASAEAFRQPPAEPSEPVMWLALPGREFLAVLGLGPGAEDAPL